MVYQQFSAVILDGRTLQSSCESGTRAGYDGYNRLKGSPVSAAEQGLRAHAAGIGWSAFCGLCHAHAT
jgi:hypothetical protein